MAGRPKRSVDPELAACLRRWRQDSGLTHSSVAEQLGVATSTLTRSLETDSFSADLRGRICGLLDAEGGSVGLAGLSVDGISAKDLRLLHKFVNLIPRAERILKEALVRRAGGVKS
ncbi:helix-turn-helix domain-containing protein [Bradyrhizobium prioriisuperbiae]|uniref:helix-turn-helix domain-containing protein n=1 Tax=Bradyrhizobium prioriisuperbiae TaxID=2854389 RepID=UPI0038993F4F